MGKKMKESIENNTFKGAVHTWNKVGQIYLGHGN